MEQLYHNLSPEEVGSVSEHFLSVTQPVQCNPFIAELTKKIEAEQTVLQEAIRTAHRDELANLIVSADQEFTTAFNSFKRLVSVKAHIETVPEECKAARQISSIIEFEVSDLDELSRKEMISRVKWCVDEIRNCDNGRAISRARVDDLFAFLRCSFQVLELLFLEREIGSIDIPPLSVMGRRLAVSLQDLHSHIKSYARLGNEKYKAPLFELEQVFEERTLYGS